MIEPGAEHCYSAVADHQLDEIEAADPDLHSALLTICEHILDQPGLAHAASSAITTAHGIRMMLHVPGHAPYKVFWSLDPVRIEAVFPYDRRSR